MPFMINIYLLPDYWSLRLKFYLKFGLKILLKIWLARRGSVASSLGGALRLKFYLEFVFIILFRIGWRGTCSRRIVRSVGMAGRKILNPILNNNSK